MTDTWQVRAERAESEVASLREEVARLQAHLDCLTNGNREQGCGHRVVVNELREALREHAESYRRLGTGWGVHTLKQQVYIEVADELDAALAASPEGTHAPTQDAENYCGKLFPVGPGDALYCNRPNGHDGFCAREPWPAPEGTGEAPA